MESEARDLVSEFARSANAELDSALAVIAHCLKQLDDSQCWERPVPGMNSVANLLLHLSGNVRQWMIAGVGGVPDTRERQKEFDANEGAAANELLDQLQATVREAQQVLQTASGDDLMATRRVQGFDVSGLEAALHSITHFRGHTQEIVHMTRRIKGDDYRFKFVPNAEQGGV